MKSYLSDRYQRVKIGSTYIDYNEIYKGVPKGSVLGPLLFDIFLNDLILSYKETPLCNFADDNSIYSSGSSVKIIEHNLQAGIDFMLEWFNNNSMKANPDKFHLLLISRKGNPKFELTINGFKLEGKESIKLLGITIDTQLTFKNHINNICDTAQNRLFALLRIHK